MYHIKSHVLFTIFQSKFQTVYPNCLFGISPLLCYRHLKHKRSQNKVLSFPTPKFILLWFLYLSQWHQHPASCSGQKSGIIIDLSFTHTTQPIYQQVLSALASKYLLNLTLLIITSSSPSTGHHHVSLELPAQPWGRGELGRKQHQREQESKGKGESKSDTF